MTQQSTNHFYFENDNAFSTGFCELAKPERALALVSQVIEGQDLAENFTPGTSRVHFAILTEEQANDLFVQSKIFLKSKEAKKIVSEGADIALVCWPHAEEGKKIVASFECGPSVALEFKVLEAAGFASLDETQHFGIDSFDVSKIQKNKEFATIKEAKQESKKNFSM